MSRKAPTPIRSTPSSAPLETMVTKQQAHIDDLVTKNRSLEQTVSKVRAELSQEKARWEVTVQQLKHQSKVEQAEWKEGCDSLQSLWRIEHLRAVVDLEKERTAAIKLREELRLARLARLQRDFQISMFQVKESELEDRVQQLVYELEVQERETDGEMQIIDSLTKRLEDVEEELNSSREESKQLEKSLSGLRAEHTKVLSSTSTDSVALERSKLEVSGLQSSLAKLQEQHKEVERTNADLLRQLEKWRNMESRDTAELESLRKRKIELEVQVKQQEERVAASVHIEKERDKLHVKIQKYKVSLEEHQEALEEANKELDERENEVDALKTKVSTLEAQIKSLSTNDPFKVYPSPKAAKASSSKTIFVDDDVEDDGAKSPSPPPSPPKRVPKSQLKPTIKKKADAPEDSDVQVVEAFRSPQLSPFEFGGATDDEVEEVVPPKKGKGKAPAVPEAAPAKRPRARPKKTQTAPSTEPEDDDVEHVGTVDKGKGKRKAVDSSSVIPPKKRTKKVPVSDKSDSDGVAPVKPPPKKKDPPKPKPKAKASEPILAHDADAGEVSAAPKKKKRKINIFSSSDAPPSFDFGIKSSAQGLNIPSELSPIKDGGPSMLGKALSGLGTNHRR